jgi:hypothetical protein
MTEALTIASDPALVMLAAFIGAVMKGADL